MASGMYMTRADVASQYRDLRCFINNEPVSLVDYSRAQTAATPRRVSIDAEYFYLLIQVCMLL